MGAKEKLEAEVLIAARDVGIGTILFRNSLAKKLDLNLTESLCLTLLGVKGRMSPSELSRLIGLTTGSTTTLLDRLEKKDFIQRKANDADRRGVIVELTGHHGAVSRPMVENVQKAHKELIHGYSTDELLIISDFLRRFTDNLMINSSDVSHVLEE